MQKDWKENITESDSTSFLHAINAFIDTEATMKKPPLL